MESISWTKKKTNEEVLRTVRDKCTFLDYSKTLENGWICPEIPDELHYIILKGIIQGKITERRPRNTYIGHIKCYARVNTFKELKEKSNNWPDWKIEFVNQLLG